MCGIVCLIQYGGSKIDSKKASDCLTQLKSRGPDKETFKIIKINDNVEIYLGFARLSIMDTSDAGVQPFYDDNGNYVVCNGEIYNYKLLAKNNNITLQSECDCEIILPLINKLGFENVICHEFDAEFAIMYYHKGDDKFYAARDKYGVRPLFYGYNTITQTIGFASELKALHSIMEFVEQVPPNKIISIDLKSAETNVSTIIETKEYYSYKSLTANLYLNNINYIRDQINYYLTEAVKKRLFANRPIGFLLSGGLDSSLVVAIATKILGPENIVCFSIGIEGSPDIEAAIKVVKFLGIIQHHIIPFAVKKGLKELSNVIKIIETYDITTVRASVAQYIMAKYIRKNTNIKVLLSGEGSDEIHGSYRYFRDAPNIIEFHQETVRLISDLCYFDNLRADRTMAANGLEIRIPFLDFEYVEFIKRINPTLLLYRPDHMEKQIIRDSFKNYLPEEILYRSKEAFSDAISSTGINWIQFVQKHSDENISDDELINNPFKINKPLTKDALLFRQIFDSFYQNRDNVMPYYWLPKFQKENNTNKICIIYLFSKNEIADFTFFKKKK